MYASRMKREERRKKYNNVDFVVGSFVHFIL